MNAAVYHAKLAKALDRQGGLFSLADVLERISDGRMQSFVSGNSWAVTQISVYPRRRQLEVVAAVGDLEDHEVLDERMTMFAFEMGVDRIATFARLGWKKYAEPLGWKIRATNYLYCKDL